MAERNIYVKKVKEEYVTPFQETPKHNLFLTEFDKRLSCYLPIVLVYDRCLDKTGEDAAKVLRQALARVLIFFYPLAGRLREDTTNIDVVCNSKGALFVEAQANCTLEYVKNLKDEQVFSASAMREFLLPFVCDELPLSEFPLLAIQVTKFTCGGFVVGMKISHTMMDGVGIDHFLTALGDMARDAVSPPSPLPVWERKRLDGLKPPEFITVPQHGRLADTKLTRTAISIGNSSIEKLKQRIVNESMGNALVSCTSFEALSALIFTSYKKATKTEVSGPGFALDLRRFVKPPIPDGYYGNCLAMVVVSKEEYEKRDSERLGMADVVKAMRRAKIRAIQEHSDMRKVDDMNIVMLFSDWRRFGQGLEFGWGKWDYMTSLYEALTPTTILLPARGVETHTDVLIFLPPQTDLSLFKSEIERGIEGGAICTPLLSKI